MQIGHYLNGRFASQINKPIISRNKNCFNFYGMRKFLIATHGAFAQGIKSSLELIVGETENLFLIQAYLDQNISVEDELMPILDALKDR
jgi:hypothetical protein